MTPFSWVFVRWERGFTWGYEEVSEGVVFDVFIWFVGGSWESLDKVW